MKVLANKKYSHRIYFLDDSFDEYILLTPEAVFGWMQVLWCSETALLYAIGDTLPNEVVAQAIAEIERIEK